MLVSVDVTPLWSKLRTPVGGAGTSRLARVGHDVLVVVNVVAQGLTVAVLMLGERGRGAAPVAGGCSVALLLLLYFYTRWMFPFLRARHVLAVMALKELGVIVLIAVAVGVVVLVQWLVQ